MTPIEPDREPVAGASSDPVPATCRQPAHIGAAAPHWRCFHCDEVFVDRRAAAAHFGADETAMPACRIKAGAERSMVEALRRAEKDAADAWQAIQSESTEAARAYHAQAARHQEQLRIAEELGYERGLTDGRAESVTDGIGP